MISTTEEQSAPAKPLGAYLIEAGMITPEQLEIALKNQHHSGKRLGTILVDCGWVKQQTIEYVIDKIVLPRRNTKLSSNSQPNNTHLTLVEQINSYPPITSSSSQELEFSLSPKKITRFLVRLVAILVLCSLFFQFSIYFLPDYPLRDTFAPIFNIGSEYNIPAFYSWSALLFCAILLAIVAQAKKIVGDRYADRWRVLAVIFVYLSIDEAIKIHEKFVMPLRTSLNTGGLLYYAWVIPGAIFVGIFLLGFNKFIKALPPRIKRLFLTAGTVFVAGAIGMELVSGAYVELYTANNFTTVILNSIEESMEMFGIVIFIYALLSYMSSELNGLNLKIKIAEGKKYI